jgi:hypothetical protein
MSVLHVSRFVIRKIGHAFRQVALLRGRTHLQSTVLLRLILSRLLVKRANNIRRIGSRSIPFQHY